MDLNRRLLLFDIDGTLLRSGGAGENALKAAVKNRFGFDEDLAGISLSGRTDGLIARALLAKHGLPETPENITALLDSYLEALGEKLPQHQGTLCPGIIELLDALVQREDCVLALLTGNVRRGAELKLSHYGVWHYFKFGAFSDDHHLRNELGSFARARAREHHGEEFPPERIYVLGDTPLDIECGRAFGAKTVAIATGYHPLEELAAHQPDLLFTDLSDTPAVIEKLFA